jgi:hypothetical protein
MTPASMPSSSGRTAGWAACVALLCCIACESQAPASPEGVPSPDQNPPGAQQELRIVNQGPADAGDLTVIFPDSRVAYGDVAAGTQTMHRPVPGGVYAYAAYRLVVNGTTIQQPVIDWVGESPLRGRAFTYVITVDPSRPAAQTVRLVDVMRDE